MHYKQIKKERKRNRRTWKLRDLKKKKLCIVDGVIPIIIFTLRAHITGKPQTKHRSFIFYSLF